MFAIYHSLRILVILLWILLIFIPEVTGSMLNLRCQPFPELYGIGSTVKPGATLPEFTLWLKLAIEAMAHL